MIPVFAPRFDLDECRSDAERAFVEALHARADAGGWFADSWRVWDDRLTVSVCVCDSEPEYNCVLRTLRVDFDEGAVQFGPDETHQFATDLDPARPGVSALSGLPIVDLAAAAADWLEREIRRPIVRREWDRPDCRGVAPRLWALADTGESVTARGQRTPDFGPPDRVVPVRR
ncbi:hypothetical protein [Alienimonas californiensis]|uniref:Uncharacterized protein n=1 Tax=Alienimonas californiensis TaxID=2527989 RepID=A0A517P6C2_9PLAN|nr:hypothetical protein [Alienimonas californiensis]QDT14917.1 hypothetical protein CA12_09970 [Alienimonas californiensis]